MKDTASSCVSRKHMYRRLCGTSLYEVSKYSYDDKNHSWISSSRKIKYCVNKILSSESEDRYRIIYLDQLDKMPKRYNRESRLSGISA